MILTGAILSTAMVIHRSVLTLDTALEDTPIILLTGDADITIPSITILSPMAMAVTTVVITDHTIARFTVPSTEVMVTIREDTLTMMSKVRYLTEEGKESARFQVQGAVCLL